MASPTLATRRGTAMPDSDSSENQKVVARAAAGWVVNSLAIGSNATAVSYGSAVVIVNGKFNLIVTSTFLLSGTLAASTTGVFVHMYSSGSAFRSVVCTATTLSSVAFAPAIASANSEIPIGFTIVACTATAFNGGTNSLADSSYTVSHYNLVGPTGLAISTELYTVVPG